ncbi:MAG: hypothetical protein AB7O57_02880 [Hyphomicrobiaceae bacterium]
MSRHLVTDRPDVGERNGLADARAYHAERHAQQAIRRVCWTTPGLRVTRLRLLSDPGFPAWDVSYCHGMIGSEHVDVDLPFDQLAKRGIARQIVNYAKQDGVHAKSLGILDCISTLN